MKKITNSLIGLALVGLALLTLTTVFHSENAEAQQSTITTPGDYGSRGSFTFTELNVMGSRTSTNVAAFWDNTGTNFFRINPTNATPQFRIAGTLYTGITTNVPTTNQGGVARTWVVVNGLVVGIQ